MAENQQQEYIRKYRSKTINQLLNKRSVSENQGSKLVERCSELENQPVDSLTIEDMRLMIGQNVGTEFIIPFALIELQQNVLAEGDFYPGDLIKNVFDLPPAFWDSHEHFRTQLTELIQKSTNLFLLDEAKIDYKKFINQ